MTFTKLKTRLTGAGLSAIALTCTALIPASAMAGEKTADITTSITQFEVARTTDGVVKASVKAFSKGDYAKSIALNKAAIRRGMSKRKTAVAQSNLCASWAMLGDLVQAEKACETALDLRPDYKPARANMDLLTLKLAEK